MRPSQFGNKEALNSAKSAICGGLAQIRRAFRQTKFKDNKKMLKQLTITTLFLILTLTFLVSMLGVDEAQAATVNPPDYFWSFSTHKSFTALWQDPDHAFGWITQYYNIRYRKKGDTSWTELSNNISQGGSHGGGKIKIPDLTPSTTYEYQARTKAATLFVSKTSDWSATQTAKTKANGTPTTVGSIPDRRPVVAGSTITLGVSNYFSDPNNDPLTYTATSSDTSIATVSVSGANVSISTLVPGSATITVTATDPFSATATQTFTVPVKADGPEPRGSLGDKTIKVGGPDYVRNVSPVFYHTSGDTLTYSATSSDTSIATANMSGSALTVTAVGAGSATITITATDTANATATQSFTVTVNPNSAPVAVGTIPAQTVRVGVTAGTVDLSNYFNDPDGYPLTYSATSSDTSKTTVSVSDATLTITPVAAGSATITITATDTANATATQSISVTVEPNSAPVRVGSIPTQKVSLSGTAATVDLSSYFSDPEGHPLTYSATSSNPSRAIVSVSDATLTITAVATGWTTITVNATDTYNAAATQTFSVNVISNRAPISVGTIPKQTVRVDGDDVTLDLSSYFSDPDGNPLTYSATSSSTSRATVSLSDSTVTITAVAAGWSTISVKATDPDNASRTRSFSVKVVASDALNPVGSIPTQTVALGGTGTATVDVSSYFSGLPGDTVTYSATASDTSKATVSVSDATVTITGVAAGSTKITVTATLNSNTTATQTISVTVYANRAPTAVGTIPTLNTAQTWNEQFGVSGYFSDPDGNNTLTYSASSSDELVAEAGISPTHSSAVYVFGNGVGTATVTVTATDPDGLTATQTFSVNVKAQTVDVVPGLSSTEQLLLGKLLTYDTIIFNELCNSADDANDWLELRNVSSIDIPIDEWQLRILTGEGNVVIPFPKGTVIPAGGVLLITNTEMAIADASVTPVVIESFALPQSEFALILRSPNVFGDIAGNYYEGQKERPKTSPALTVDTVWNRTQPIVSGYRAEAWVQSTIRNGLGSPGYQPSPVVGDLNNDSVVNILDLVMAASKFGTTSAIADLNGDNTVDIRDLVIVAGALSAGNAAPTAKQSDAETVNTWLKLARQNESKIVKTDMPKGFSYERGIEVLETLARELTPNKTALLANYPNPFNPETWIPYQLSKAADVTVTIYASDGNVVRTLAIGHRDVGTYKNRSQAAYWDGRNELGESVASGVYFYALTAGDFSATRKMLILK